MTLMTNTKLTGSVLAVLACASFMSCSRSDDRVATAPLQDSAISESTGTRNVVSAPQAATTTTETASNTTLAADDTPKTLDTTGSVPPAAADESSASNSTEKATTETKTKKTKHRKHSKKAKKSASAVVPEDDSYFYDSELATTDSGMINPAQNVGAVDASRDFDDSVSGTTLAPVPVRESGLSPFFHEPDSRLPIQIGSGQLTGEDKSTTILEGPSLFQDPAALGRDLVR